MNRRLALAVCVLIGILVAIAGIFLMLYTEQRPYYTEISINDDEWTFYSWIDTITKKGTFSTGDVLHIDLRVVTGSVVFYIQDGYGQEWMRQVTAGFKSNWTIPTTGDYFFTVENPSSYINPNGYLTVTVDMVVPKYETTNPYDEPGEFVMAAGFTLIFLCLILAPAIVKKKHHQASSANYDYEWRTDSPSQLSAR